MLTLNFRILLMMVLATGGFGWLPASASPDAPDLPVRGDDPLDLPAYAIADLAPLAGGNAYGQVRFAVLEEGFSSGTVILATVAVWRLPPGDHGMRILESSRCRVRDLKLQRAHLNPEGKRHGMPSDPEHHLGDLGNILVDKNGTGHMTIRLNFPDDHRGDIHGLLLGHALTIDEHGDDFTAKAVEKPLACGVIRRIGPVSH